MTLSEMTVQSARAVLNGERRGWRGYAAFAGPAVIASIAYVDPGNFATNVQAGAKYGYGLLWVVLFANLIAMLFQALSAKLGIVTGRNLAELCREQFSPQIVVTMWVVSEIAAMATDIAELVGGALGFSLLFSVPLLIGMIITGVVVYVVLMFDRQGFRPVELIIGACVSVIALCYILELFMVPVDWGRAAFHSVVPQIAGSDELLLAVGIIGATIMPHAIFLHSGLTQTRIPPRSDVEKQRIIGISNREVVLALALAGAVNMAMVVMASAAFHAGHSDVDQLQSAYTTLTPLFGIGAAFVFLASLLVSGVASSVVGTMAGQVVMQGFVGFAIPVWVRRLVTMLPAFVIVVLGVDVTYALIVSQVVLSLALPVPMIALIFFTRRADVMGKFANTRYIQAAAIFGAVAILFLNIILILDTVGVPFPGLSIG